MYTKLSISRVFPDKRDCSLMNELSPGLFICLIIQTKLSLNIPNVAGLAEKAGKDSPGETYLVGDVRREGRRRATI